MVGMVRLKERGIRYWPKLLQNVLIDYVQAREITKAVKDCHNTKQKPNEDKMNFSAG